MLSDRSSIYSRSSLGSTTNSRTSPRLTSISSSSSSSTSRNHYKPISSSTSYHHHHQQPYLTQSMLMAHCIASSGTPTITGYDLASSNKHSNSYRRNYNPSHSSSRYTPTTNATNTTTTTRLDVGQHHHASNALRFVSSSNNSNLHLSAYESRYTPNLPPRGLLSSTKPPTTTPLYRPKLRDRPLLSSISSTRPDITQSADSRRVIPDNYRLSSYHNSSSNNNYRPPTSTTNMTKKTTDLVVGNDEDHWSSDLTRNISRNKYIIKFREQEIKPSVEVSWDLDQTATQRKKPTNVDAKISNVTTPKLKEEKQQEQPDNCGLLKVVQNEEQQKEGNKQSDILLTLSQVKIPKENSSEPEPKKENKKNVRNLKIKVKNPQQQLAKTDGQDSKLKSALGEINGNNNKTKELKSELVVKDSTATNEKSGKKTAKKSTEEKVKPSKTKLKSPRPTDGELEKKFSSDKKLVQPDPPKELKKDDSTVLENDTKRIRFREYCFEDFDFVSVLGHGGWGFVFLAELKNHETFFAVKCIKKLTILEDDDLESIMIERKVLTLGNIHPFICKLFCTFENEGYLFFVMEYCAGGDLMFHVQKEGKFSESRCRFYAAEIICAIRFLHNRHIIYRDLKLDNILLDAAGHIRLVDFGMCQCRTYREELLPSNFCGTPEYISPEIIKGVPYNHSVDWWSFGVLLYEMVVGKMPFRGSDENELLWNVCYEKIHYPHFLSPELRSLLQLLLERDPVKRLGMATCTAGDIYEQPWFEGINWKKIEELKVEPPFVPQVKSPKDVQNFDSDFTDATPQLSPVEESTIERIDQQLFHGFSYTNPNLFC